MTKKRWERPSVSMRRDVFRAASWAAFYQGKARAAFVEEAIREKIARDRVPLPPENYTPRRKAKGRPIVDAVEQEAARHFTW